jgi:hypothetical protein
MASSPDAPQNLGQNDLLVNTIVEKEKDTLELRI